MESDMNAPATRAELQQEISSLRDEMRTGFSTLREEASAMTRRFALELVNTNTRIDRLEFSVNENMNQNTSRILAAMDYHMRMTESSSRGVTIHGQMLTEHAEKLKAHERRLDELEG